MFDGGSENNGKTMDDYHNCCQERPFLGYTVVSGGPSLKESYKYKSLPGSFESLHFWKGVTLDGFRYSKFCCRHGEVVTPTVAIVCLYTSM